jgi:PTH1 family peptidyl-tRNA hydrolase
MTDLYLIAGLGNPGPKYEHTRHNVGFRAVERLAEKHGLAFGKTEHKAHIATGTVAGARLIVAKPMTYMNVSGDSVAPLARFYKIDPAHILIVCDDLDIPPGTLRIRKEGSSGGQNGLKHIIERMGTNAIPRVRIGIGRPPGRQDPADYVLLPWRAGEEADTAADAIERAVVAMETWLTDGIEEAMNRCNGTGAPKPQRVLKPPRPNPAP